MMRLCLHNLRERKTNVRWEGLDPRQRAGRLRERFSELRGFQGGLMIEKELPLLICAPVQNRQHKLGHKHQG
jgi:hypothetical protein